MQKLALIPAILSMFISGFQQFSVDNGNYSKGIADVQRASAPYYADAKELIYTEQKSGEVQSETYITFTLSNLSQLAPINGYDLSMESFPEFYDADRIVLTYPSGMVMRLTWADEAHSDTVHTHYTPTNFKPEDYGIDFDSFFDTELSELPELWRVDMGEYIDCIVYFSK